MRSRSRRVRALGLEDHSVTWAQQIEYAAAFAGVELVPAGELVEGLRRVKDAGEIDRIRRACAIADDAFQSLLPMLGERPTEREFALALEFAMRERGASGNSFDPIIASGPNGSKPHHMPSDRVIERNELIVCDFGCIVDGYCSDMTRHGLGRRSRPRRAAPLRRRAREPAGRAAPRWPSTSRVPTSTGRRATSSPTRAGPTRSRTRPGTASGSRSTRPRGWRPRPVIPCSSNDVVTVEPGVYLPGIGGVRIEDTLVVGATGAEPLTLTPKDLVL